MRKNIYIIVFILIIVGLFYIYPAIEWSSPEIDVGLDSEYLGVEPFDIEVRDQGKGLKNVSVVLKSGSGESVLFNKNYPPGVKGDNIEITLDPKKIEVQGGRVELIVSAEDRSHIKIFSGNKSTLTKELTLDMKPPEIEMVSTEQYINHGGSGLVVYRTSPDVTESGVIVEDYFFPGYRAGLADENVYFAFFAYPYDIEPGKNLFVSAIDEAGNVKRSGLAYNLRNINYRESDINISDNFIQNVIGPLSGENSEELTQKEKFLKVNSELRKINDNTIKEVGSDSKEELMWEGPFTQLSNSKVEANFADHRTYMYNDESIDNQYHLGYDLAVTKRYPIEAANNGTVAYAGDLGIYGNTVIIDHGMGVSTLYGHMSTIDVNVGDRLRKNDIIGKTGETGLAAGDHLHYGVYVNGVAVRPIEWWDDKWIKDNVLLKIQEARTEFGKESPQGQ
jgi:murein DD-endopeptidase MepM/ murein hydrolase activator NlpD